MQQRALESCTVGRHEWRPTVLREMRVFVPVTWTLEHLTPTVCGARTLGCEYGLGVTYASWFCRYRINQLITREC